MNGLVEATKSAWPLDGWEVWSALVADTWDADRETAKSMVINLVAEYMVRNDISIQDDQVFWRGKPYVPKIMDCPAL